MVDKAFITRLVHEVLPEAEVEAIDFTGGGDHWHVVVVDPSFEGMRSFRRQRLVMEPFKPHIRTEEVHALDLVCLTPEEGKNRQEQQEQEPDPGLSKGRP